MNKQFTVAVAGSTAGVAMALGHYYVAVGFLFLGVLVYLDEIIAAFRRH